MFDKESAFEAALIKRLTEKCGWDKDADCEAERWRTGSLFFDLYFGGYPRAESHRADGSGGGDLERRTG